METFPALLALCAGNSPVTGEFPSQRPVTRSFDVSLILAWIHSWVNNRYAGDLRRHRTHYDVTVIFNGDLNKLSSIEVSVSVISYVPPFYADVISYLCPKLNLGGVNIWQCKSLDPGGRGCNINLAIFKLISGIDIVSIFAN